MPQKQEDSILRELKTANCELKKIHADLELIHQPFWKWSLKEFSIGVIKGVGFVVGTTIIAAAVLYLIQHFFDLTPLANLF